jgi:hypothetical protein
MPAPASLNDLVERFDRNRAAYRSGQYNEAQTRRELVVARWRVSRCAARWISAARVGPAWQ